MRPRPPAHNPVDCLLYNPVGSGELRLAGTILYQAANLFYFLFSELVASVVLTLSDLWMFACAVFISLGRTVKPLVSQVVHVVSVRAYEKMFVIYTLFVVTPVANLKVFIERSKNMPIRKAMDIVRVLTDFKMSISSPNFVPHKINAMPKARHVFWTFSDPNPQQEALQVAFAHSWDCALSHNN
jgi:hypothetical protein